MPHELPPTQTANPRAGHVPRIGHRLNIWGALPDLGPSSVPALLDHPVDHPDPTGSVWSRLDRRPVRREQARSVWNRPDRRAPGYGSGGCGFESLAARQNCTSEGPIAREAAETHFWPDHPCDVMRSGRSMTAWAGSDRCLCLMASMGDGVQHAGAGASSQP
jgi:hypothetical protein